MIMSKKKMDKKMLKNLNTIIPATEQSFRLVTVIPVFSCRCGERKKPLSERNWYVSSFVTNMVVCETCGASGKTSINLGTLKHTNHTF